ncbi:MAG: tripartite tricarboxylate transporter substrate binding protein [Alphaproteobacteria bacterium]|nr:tripartite tricarboxylate transporter substrate binding protein [Alphaproteobacteria bacterium]
MPLIRTLIAAASVAILGIAAPADAQTYPTRPVKIVSPFPPGSAIDIISRVVADKLTPALGQPVLVENRPGAGGNIGAIAVAQAAPDGYTVLLTSSAIAAAPALYKTLNYDPVNDFAAVAPVVVLPNVLVVAPNNNKGIKSVADLVAYAKKNPGKLTYASAGSGSATHMSDEKFRVAAGFDAVHVAYKGTPEAMTDIMGGNVDYMFTTMASGIPLIQNNQLVALSVGAPQRSPLLPNVPTTAEAGVREADYMLWAGMFLPAKTPRDIVMRLHAEVARAVQMPDMKERFAKLGGDPMVMAPDAFAAQMKQEIATNIELVKKAGIQAN